MMKAVSSYGDNEISSALDAAWETEKLGDDTSITGRLIKGDTHLLGAICQMIQQSYVKAMWNFRKSWKQYETVLKAVEEYHEDDADELRAWAQFGVGMFNLIISLLPPTAHVVVGWLGFSGDRTIGLTLIRDCYQSDTFMSPLAALLLCSYDLTISVFTGQHTPELMQEAIDILTWSEARFPSSVLFGWMKSRLHRCQKDLDAAIESARVCLPYTKDIDALAILFHYQMVCMIVFICLLLCLLSCRLIFCVLYVAPISELDLDISIVWNLYVLFVFH
jgi:hypothetical protein